MREPPKITRPMPWHKQIDAMARFAEEVNAVTAWMQEALQEMEQARAGDRSEIPPQTTEEGG